MTASAAAWPRRQLAAMAGLLLAVGVLGVAAPSSAQADTRPPTVTAGNPVTVSADPLPTVQINGVVWSQVTVGTTVYVTGSFTSARPEGAPVCTQETPRANLLAYSITTGALLPWAPTLNAQGLVITASPDGTRIYVGGDFTVANGRVRNRVAAFDTGGGLLGWAPSANGEVRAIAATASTVYLGGSLTAIGPVSRNRLAAVTTDGALLGWAPQPGDGPTQFNRNGDYRTSDTAMSLLVVGGGSQVVAAGRWDLMNGVRATGITALDPITGATRPYTINTMITNQGINSAVYSLSTDGTSVFGTVYDFWGPGDLEGSFSVRPGDGGINWVSSCWGDTYSSFPVNGALYQAGHPHACEDIGGFPEQLPRVNKFAMALSVAPTSLGTGYRSLYGPWKGIPAPSQLNWFPTLSRGTYTGQDQAGWSVTGTSQYVAYGGEFLSVNGTPQQGLVRFALPSIAPNRVGPEADPGLTPSVTSTTAGQVRVAWRATSDPDNELLSYRVTRSDQPGTPIWTGTQLSRWWDRPGMGFVDRSATPGAQYTYRVTATDPYGNAVAGSGVAVTVAGGTADPGAYARTVLADGPAHYWRLGDIAGTGRSLDLAGFDDLLAGSGVTGGAAGALAGSGDTAATFNGTVDGTASESTRIDAPNVYSVEAWFSTRSTTGGSLFDFGSVEHGNSNNHDRHVYLDDAGHLAAGVWDGQLLAVTSPRAYNDGAWHQVVATLSPSGLALYVDGTLVASRADAVRGTTTRGLWRIGGDTRWVGTSDWFPGAMDEAAVYTKALTASQVTAHYTAGRTGTGTTPPPPNQAPTASFTSTTSDLTVSVDGRSSSDPDGGVASWRWTFGDGATTTGATASHTYAAAGTYTVGLTVTDGAGATGSTTRTVTVTAPTGQPVIAQDSFGRTVSGGLGTADVGGAWTAWAGGTRQSVTPGVAQLSLDAAGQNTGSYLGGVAQTSAELATTFTLSSAPTGSGTYVYLTGRRVAGQGEYRVRVRVAPAGQVYLVLSRLTGTTEAFPGGEVLVPGLTWTPGTALQADVVVRGTGTTTVTASVWASGTTRPVSPALTRTDTTAVLQAPGAVGLTVHRPSDTTAATAVRVTGFTVTSAG